MSRELDPVLSKLESSHSVVSDDKDEEFENIEVDL